MKPISYGRQDIDENDGYSSFLIARGKQKKISILALTALLINIVCCYLSIRFLHIGFNSVIFATAIAYLFYLILLNYSGGKLLNVSNKPSALLNSAFPYKLLIPYGIGFILLVKNADNLLFLIPLVLYFVLNLGSLRKVKDTFVKIVKRPDVINI